MFRAAIVVWTARGGDDFGLYGRVAAGGTFIPEEVRQLYRQRQMTPDVTPREMDVLSLVVDGLSNEEIAGRLDIAYEGVKRHVRHLFEKLGVTDRVNLVNEARRRGFSKR